MDYYKTLGVNRNASQDEIKKAFKKQAMKHHPDKGGDANTFQQINEAYETLGNSNKKQQYDMFGTTGNQNPRTQTWEFGGDFPNDIGDIFNDLDMLKNSDIACLVFNEKFKLDTLNINNCLVSKKSAPEGWEEVVKMALEKI